jgi:hypothetical protein
MELRDLEATGRARRAMTETENFFTLKGQESE